MFLIRKYIDQIQSRQLKDIQEVIEIEGVDTRLIRYFKAFKKSNDLPTCRNLSEVFKVIIEKGYYYEHEFLQKYDDDFFIKLLDDVEVYLFLFIYFFFSNRLKKEKTIFHYQKEKPEFADDLDELGIQDKVLSLQKKVLSFCLIRGIITFCYTIRPWFLESMIFYYNILKKNKKTRKKKI